MIIHVGAGVRHLPLTSEEKERAFAALERARQLREEDRRRGRRWTPAGQEIDALREERDRELA